MRGSWSRFWAYVEELEEAMRVAGQHLAEVEETLSRRVERETWKPDQISGATSCASSRSAQGTSTATTR